MDRRNTGDVLYFALDCAIQDRISFIDAFRDDRTEPAVISALADIAAFQRLKNSLFSNRQTMNEYLKNSPKVTLEDLRKFVLVDTTKGSAGTQLCSLP